jgi:hypothetical protein
VLLPLERDRELFCSTLCPQIELDLCRFVSHHHLTRLEALAALLLFEVSFESKHFFFCIVLSCCFNATNTFTEKHLLHCYFWSSFDSKVFFVLYCHVVLI